MQLEKRFRVSPRRVHGLRFGYFYEEGLAMHREPVCSVREGEEQLALLWKDHRVTWDEAAELRRELESSNLPEFLISVTADGETHEITPEAVSLALSLSPGMQN